MLEIEKVIIEAAVGLAVKEILTKIKTTLEAKSSSGVLKFSLKKWMNRPRFHVLSTGSRNFDNKVKSKIPGIMDVYTSSYNRLKRQDDKKGTKEATGFEEPGSYNDALHAISVQHAQTSEIDIVFVLFEIDGKTAAFIEGSYDRKTDIFYLWYLCAHADHKDLKLMRSVSSAATLQTKGLVFTLFQHIAKNGKYIVYEVEHHEANPAKVPRLKLFNTVEEELRQDLYHRLGSKLTDQMYRNYICDCDYFCPPYGFDSSGSSEQQHLVAVPLDADSATYFGTGSVPISMIQPMIKSVYRMYYESHPFADDQAYQKQKECAGQLIDEFTKKYPKTVPIRLLSDAVVKPARTYTSKPRSGNAGKTNEKTND